MEAVILTIVICTIVIIIAFAFFSFVACATVVKAEHKQLIAIIDECEKIDRDELFVSTWKKTNR